MNADIREYLFANLPVHVRQEIEGDEVAMYSVSPHWMSRTLVRILQKLNVATVLDACACVGGDTMSLALAGFTVRAIEKDATRFDMLRNNLGKIGFGDSKISITCASIMTAPLTQVDAVYIDAPWGGPEYKTMKCVDLFLDGLDVSEAVIRVWPHATICVVLKVPSNFNISGFYKALAKALPDVQSCLFPERSASFIVLRHRPQIVPT